MRRKIVFFNVGQFSKITFQCLIAICIIRAGFIYQPVDYFKEWGNKKNLPELTGFLLA